MISAQLRAAGMRLAGAASMVLTIVLMFGLATGAPAYSVTAQVDPAAADRAQRALAGALDGAGLSTAALTVAGKDGAAVSNGIGELDDGRPVTGDTAFVIGSTSKSFTALAVMQLVDRGAVNLDLPVRRYVPEFRPAAYGDQITVRQVLQQTSGLPAAAGGPILKSARDGTMLQAVAELTGVRPTGPPGSSWQYANANYVLAALVVERAARLPYADYLQTAILDPLGMTRTYLNPDDARAAGVITGHRYWFGLPIRSGPTIRSAMLPAGYIVSTAADLGRYLHLYLNQGLAPDGTRVISAERLQEMTSPGPQAHLGSWAGGASARYAMGWFVGGPWGPQSLFHPGNTPDSSAMLAVIPHRDIGVATLVNASHEMPLPGNPSVIDAASRAAVDAAIGVPPRTPSLRTFYLVFDLLALLALAAAAWALTAAARRRPPTFHRTRVLVVSAVMLVVAGGLVLLPLLAGYGWSAAFLWAPDLTVVLAILAVLLTAGGGLRLIRLFRQPSSAQAGEDRKPPARPARTSRDPVAGRPGR